MSDLSLSARKEYWRSLVRQQPVPDPRLYPGLVEELRDALHELPDAPESRRWREEWTGRA